MSAAVEIVEALGLIVGVWFTLVGWKLVPLILGTDVLTTTPKPSL